MSNPAFVSKVAADLNRMEPDPIRPAYVDHALLGGLVGAGIPLAYRGIRRLFQSKEEREEEDKKNGRKSWISRLLPVLGGAAAGTLLGNYYGNSQTINAGKTKNAYLNSFIRNYRRDKDTQYAVDMSGLSTVAKKLDKLTAKDAPSQGSIAALKPTGIKDFLSRLFLPASTIRNAVNLKAKNIANEFNAKVDRANDILEGQRAAQAKIDDERWNRRLKLERAQSRLDDVYHGVAKGLPSAILRARDPRNYLSVEGRLVRPPYDPDYYRMSDVLNQQGLSGKKLKEALTTLRILRDKKLLDGDIIGNPADILLPSKKREVRHTRRRGGASSSRRNISGGITPDDLMGDFEPGTFDGWDDGL